MKSFFAALFAALILPGVTLWAMGRRSDPPPMQKESQDPTVRDTGAVSETGTRGVVVDPVAPTTPPGTPSNTDAGTGAATGAGSGTGGTGPGGGSR